MTGQKVKSPCKVCEERCVGCHSTCRKYEFYRARVTYVRQKVKSENYDRIQPFLQMQQMRTNMKRDNANHRNKKNYVTGGTV